VGRQRLIAPAGDEPLDQIARGDHFDSPPPNRLNRARVHAADIGDGVLGGVLHRNASDAVHQGIQPGPQRLAAGIELGVARQVVERMSLDRMDQGARLPLGRHEVVPAAGRHLGAIDAGKTTRDGIRSVEVVQQPAVEAVFAQCGLHRVDVERHAFQYRSFAAGTAAGMDGAS